MFFISIIALYLPGLLAAWRFYRWLFAAYAGINFTVILAKIVFILFYKEHTAVSVVVGISLSIDMGLMYFSIHIFKLMQNITYIQLLKLRDSFPCHCCFTNDGANDGHLSGI